MSPFGSVTHPSSTHVLSPADSGRGQRAFILEPRPYGIASAMGRSLERTRPSGAFLVAVLVGYAVVAAAIVGLGLLLVHALLPIDTVGDVDRSLPSWLAENRDAGLTDASFVASLAGDVPVLPILVAITLVVAAIGRKWRVGVFILTAVIVEVTVYRIGAIAISRERPDVARLDNLPVDHSFPSGHVAASFVVYVGIALLVSSYFERRWVSLTAWGTAIFVVAAVALSRIYRGMHHPADALSGALLGAASLLVALIAVRVYGHVKNRREDRSGFAADDRGART